MEVGAICNSVTVRESDAIGPLVITGSRVEMTGEDELPSNVVTIGSDELKTGEVIESDEERVTTEEKSAEYISLVL